MKPKELRALAKRVDGLDAAACVAGAVELRAYARLLDALTQVHASGYCGADVMTPERILSWARELKAMRKP